MPVTYHQTKLALGSDVTLLIVTDSASAVATMFHELWQKVYWFEKRFSRFLPGSELSLFNRNAGSKQTISLEFAGLLAAAKRMALLTGGLFNPFILPALQRAGYKRSAVHGYEHDYQDDHSKKAVVDIDHLEISDSWARIPYGTALDMGGCGKGYLADELAAYMGNKVEGYWFSLGGDVVAKGTDEIGKPWAVAIQSASGKGQAGAVLLPKNNIQAVATSGVTVIKGVQKGIRWHHLVDPRTQKPSSSDVLCATVYSQTALKADALASCAVILGSNEAPQFLKKIKAQAALLQCLDQKSQPFIKSFGTSLQLNGGQQARE